VAHGAHETVSPLLAMGLTSAAVVGFFAALWWLDGATTRRAARSPVFMLRVLVAA
jgi:hypothetical protein